MRCKIEGHAFCRSCIEGIPEGYEKGELFSLYRYSTKEVREAIKQLKYKRYLAPLHALTIHAAPRLLEYLSESLQNPLPEEIIFVPVPQHQNRTRDRGFNQSARIARMLTRHVPGTKVCDLIQKHTWSKPQVKTHSKVERLQNVLYTMHAQALNPHLLYVIVDDVITTGATYQEAKRALMMKGARRILGVSIAS